MSGKIFVPQTRPAKPSKTAKVGVLVPGEGVRRFLAEVEVEIDAADGHGRRRILNRKGAKVAKGRRGRIWPELAEEELGRGHELGGRPRLLGLVAKLGDPVRTGSRKVRNRRVVSGKNGRAGSQG